MVIDGDENVAGNQREQALAIIERCKAEDVEERIPVTLEDLAHSIDDEPQYWCERIRAVNLAHLPAKIAK